ncbi:acyl carrier protein [Luteibacter rhizovicinus]|uniref:Acyl carrier protein n=1 Tax=Luteibacter rhizovicinus TaxID=242606 RepID=A0A4R3YN46_9GAMM|nr:phosphopantetheine-binding protein [Luteibacter rhizovicinus]TCV94067.1 acyl carrier protein [Luteibacter rhizovicinus]
MSDPIESKVFDIIANDAKIDRSTITLESTLKDLGVTSLDAIEVIFDIEEEFKVTFPERDPNFDGDTVAGLIGALREALARKDAAPPA